MHCAVEGEATSPPATPADGNCWLVGQSASGDWGGQDGQLACYQSGSWLFTQPRDGFVLLDRSSGLMRRYNQGWLDPQLPAAPTGGATIDAEARASLAALIGALQVAGILPAG